MLLVLDNVEHVMAALLAARLMEAAPGIRLLDAGLDPLRLCRAQRVEAGGQRSPF
ncbi:hypothetical protein [Deinococcus aetherius]|uniref:hypothetical protein n=1 Tax=Deinococcus aetherius TaxID=200252 RepID=UPI00223193AE|nr:hypothetical protein [Deinococcus aetherius]